MIKRLIAFIFILILPCIAWAQDGDLLIAPNPATGAGAMGLTELAGADNSLITFPSAVPNLIPDADAQTVLSNTMRTGNFESPSAISNDFQADFGAPGSLKSLPDPIMMPTTTGQIMDVPITQSMTESPTDPMALDLKLADQNQPTCATNIFANSLAATLNQVDANDPEHVIQGWIYKTFQDPQNIRQVMACPEIAQIADDETIVFQPIEYVFPTGRRIVVNYATQPKILKQRLMTKRALPGTNDPSPRVGAPGDGNVWTNTEPAWYGILVVQSGSLAPYVGPDKNNTLSLRYLEQNIDQFYPRGAQCTSKSALASDDDMINRAVHKTVSVKDDTNDYYIAGDANLQWITWAEVALDAAITVATVGGGTVILGATKGIRATRAAKNLIGVVRDLEKIDTVQDYIKLTRQSARATEELKKIDRAKDAAAYAAKSDEIKRLGTGIKDLEKLDDVRRYKTAATSLEDVMKYRRALKAWKIPQRGNVIARTWRSLRAANTGGKTINKAAKTARAGMKSGKIRDWLFHSTLKNAGKVAKIEQASGIIYGAMKFAGDMYDWSETSTGDFTSGLEFKPLGLLSADDLDGQENVVNHGMWFMWAGNSVSPADDDAAYLQAMDFAAKFHQDLTEMQDEQGINACAVDIFVVRPIIRNPGEESAELYYLIMNDEPWSVQ